MTSSWPTATPCAPSRKHTPVSSAWVGTSRACVQLVPRSSESTMTPRSPTATRRAPAVATAIRSDCAARRAGSADNSGGCTAGARAATATERAHARAKKGFRGAALALRPALERTPTPWPGPLCTAATKILLCARGCATLTDSAPLQHARLVVSRRALDAEVVGLGLLALQTEREIAPVRQIHDELQVRPQRRQVVEVHGVPFLHAIQLPARVVAVHREDLPGILVHVQRAAAVQVAEAVLERRIHHPDAMQLVARQILVDVVPAQQLAVLELPVLQTVGIVGDVDLLLADELPVVALGAAVVHVELIRGAQVVGVGARVVEGDVRRAPHTALAGVIDPRAPCLLRLIERLLHQQHLARQARRRGGLLREIQQDVVEGRFRHARLVVLEVELLLEVHQRIRAAGGERRLPHQQSRREAPITRDVVPEHLHADLWNRKRSTADRAAHSVAVRNESGGGRIAPRGLIDALRGGRTAM